VSARVGVLGAGLALAGVVMIGAGTLAGGGLGQSMMAGAVVPVPAGTTTGRVGGMMGGLGGAGMMGAFAGASAPGPGEAGFTAGTPASPRVVRVIAGPGTTFSPSDIAVQRGETVTFEVTAVGGLVHEFMVGPADAVAADQAGTPEAADIGMMQTKSVTYTFDGTGPYAFACHAPGHYEAGMRGTITVVG
jgi:uncharacterized cupredoxin-like copper-binding protein